MITHW